MTSLDSLRKPTLSKSGYGIQYGITPPSMIETSGNDTYLGWGDVDSEGKEIIVRIRVAGNLTTIQQAYDTWTNRATAVYELLKKGA